MSEILIISQSDFEFTTNEVCDWLDYYGNKYFRLNIDKIYDVNYYEITIGLLKKEIALYDVKEKRIIDLTKIKMTIRNYK